MGNKTNKKTKENNEENKDIDEIEQPKNYNSNTEKDKKKKKEAIKELTPYEKKLEFLQLSFKNTGVVFTEKELINLKLKVTDAEKHFGTVFDYFICYNSFLFQERVHQIYDNYNFMIESFKKSRIKLIIEFDSETENENTKLEYDTLLTVALEKLEIETIIYFDFTNTDNVYSDNFFSQLIDSIDMYKYNRKFDNLYFLLSNIDYIVKYEGFLMYCKFKDYGLKKSYNSFLLSKKYKLLLETKNNKKDKEKDMEYYY